MWTVEERNKKKLDEVWQ